MAVAEWERGRIAGRTRDGLAVAGEKGARLGREQIIPADVELVITTAAADGDSSRAIAARLTAAGVPTPGGGATWCHSTVARLLARQQIGAA